MFGLPRLRLVEIGIALLLTLAALLFVGLTVWAAEIARIKVADAWARPTIGEGRTSTALGTPAAPLTAKLDVPRHRGARV